MKMIYKKNKNKGISEITIFVVSIILIFSFVVFFAYYDFDKPTFKITKNECVNIYPLVCENLFANGEHFCEKVNDTNLSEMLKIQCAYCLENNKEVCKQVEVDEINLKDINFTLNCCECIECCLDYLIYIEDLNIEWLDENCECVECGLKCKEYIYQRDEHEYNCGFDEEKGWCKGCKKYKCGEYQVEVLK